MLPVGHTPRRGVFEAHELAPGETAAKQIVERIDDLFGIDRVARENGYDFAARHRLRAEHAPTLLTTIRKNWKPRSSKRLPASKVGLRRRLRPRTMAEAGDLSQYLKWN